MSLVAPLYFSLGVETPFETTPNSVEASFSLASPSSVVAWGLPVTEAAETGESSKTTLLQGVAVGCEDGTVYVFEPSPMSHRRKRSNGSTSPHLLGANLGHPTSRSASPSSVKSSFSPFQVTRSRIVSSVSNEQAEAPKVYVDYDDEPEKLKNFLKGKGIAIDKQPGNKEGPLSRQESRKSRDDSKSAIAIALSPGSSARSVSSPPSPYLSPWNDSQESRISFPSLTLRYHVFTPHCERGQPIAMMKHYDEGRFIACLQKTGGLSIHATIDGSCIASARILDDEQLSLPSSSQARQGGPRPWIWRNLHIAVRGESVLFIACASPRTTQRSSEVVDVDDSDFEAQTRLTIFELRRGLEEHPFAEQLDKIGDIFVDGPTDTVSLHLDSTDGLALLYISNLHRVLSQALHLQESSNIIPPTSDSTTTTNPLVNPFKALKAFSADHESVNEHQPTAQRLQIDDPIDLGDVCLDGPWLGLRSIAYSTAILTLSWSPSGLLIHEYDKGKSRNLLTYTTTGIRDVQWIDQSSCVILYSDRAEVISWFPVDSDNNRLTNEPTVSADNVGMLYHHQILQTTDLSAAEYSSIVCPGWILSLRSHNGRRRLDSIQTMDITGPSQTHTLWTARKTRSPSTVEPSLTAMLPLDINTLVMGYSDGELCRSPLSSMISERPDINTTDSCATSVGAPIIALHSVISRRTGESFVVGGADDGSLIIWSLNSLKLCARWCLFITPLYRVMHIINEHDDRLYDCLLCVSQDGAIAAITLDGFQFIFLVPASLAPLRSIYIGGNNLLLTYGDHRARLWDTKTREFWRSMDIRKAAELWNQGDWKHWEMGVPKPTTALSAFPSADGFDHASALLLDVEELIRQSVSPKAVSTIDVSSLALGDTRVSTREALRCVLSTLLTFGLNDDIDRICREQLKADPTRAYGTISHNDSTVLFASRGPKQPWCISPLASALRALPLIVLLQAAMQFDDLSQAAETIVVFYITAIPQIIGPAYQPPDLAFLAHHWIRASVNEVRKAARLLYDAGISRLSDDETLHLVERWHHEVPCLKPAQERDSTTSAMALLICGSVAVAKFTLLPANILADISKSIALYLHDETSPHRGIAIDLCSRGFAIWQQYVDAVEMLRALFVLATTPRKNGISIQNPGLQARNAVLQLASENTPLFMTTLTIDILHPRDIQHRKSVLQLVIFLVRKEPLALYSNLPRLVEAVVKSLDPNVTDSRDVVLDSATEILGHIVRTFPSVDFHMGTQRLAVGTNEGPVVMYDLKTATRLYVLEGHKKRTTAVSFSPDGRRLVTVSLEESAVLVWKVGSSFTSFFMPGAPPRQGHSGSEPFKTLSFNVGDEANMSLGNTLQYVRFEWPSDRSVRLKIRDSTLTFST